MTASAIVVDGVSKSFGDVDALNGLHLDIPEGAFFVLLGPSGAGKTTTLRVIAGLETPDTGSIHLTGIDATKATRPSAIWRWCSRATRCTRSRRRRRTSRRRCGRARCPRPTSTRRSSASRSCCTSSELLERKPAQMSGGEMQRVALGRALVRDPRAFLMDEPLTNLDLKLRVEMRTELTRIHRSLGRTFLYVTNDQVEAMSMADQVAVLREGTVQQVGTPTEIYDHPANRWVATFVGSPRMNLLKCTANGRLEGDGWSLPNPGFGIQGERPALFGVRSRGPLARRPRGVGDARGHGLRRRAAGRSHAGRHRGRRAPRRRSRRRRRRPRTRSASRSARPSPSTASTCSTPTRSRQSHEHDRRPATASPAAGADPRACPARRRRFARGACVRARRLAGHRAS